MPGWQVKTSAGLMLALALAVFLVGGCGRERWEVKGAKLIGDKDKPVLLLYLGRTRSGGRGGGSSHELLTCLDLRQGTALGKYDTGDWMRPYGLTSGRLWVRQGGFRSKTWVAYSLPELKRVKEFDQPPKHREPGLNPMGSGALIIKSCEDRPAVPRRIGGELLLDGKFVCDNHSRQLLDLGDGDRLVAYQDLEKDRGKLLLGRLAKDNHWVWKTGEKELFRARPRQAHGYRVDYATRLPDGVVLVLKQADAAGDARLVVLKSDSGKPAWSVRYH